VPVVDTWELGLWLINYEYEKFQTWFFHEILKNIFFEFYVFGTCVIINLLLLLLIKLILVPIVVCNLFTMQKAVKNWDILIIIYIFNLN